MVNNNFFQDLKKEDILSSYNFARNSDFVYSEELTHDQYEDLTNNEHFIVHSDYRILYINPVINLKENDVIFSNTNFVKYLFESLKGCKNLKNLKLITHQTDLPINKKLYSLKPECISEWYSINVNHLAPNLYPIPIGLSNYYSPKNLFYENYIKTNLDRENKLEEIYINFTKNTFSKLRSPLFDKALKEEKFFVENKIIDLDKYLQQLVNYKYVLCPRGNGLDTHRIWETLYAGSIPIVEKHETVKTLDNLPAVIVDDLLDFTFNDLKNTFIDLNNKNYDKLKIQYWINKIKDNSISSNENFQFIESKEILKRNVNNYKIKLNRHRNYKLIKYYFSLFKKTSKVFKV